MCTGCEKDKTQFETNQKLKKNKIFESSDFFTTPFTIQWNLSTGNDIHFLKHAVLYPFGWFKGDGTLKNGNLR